MRLSDILSNPPKNEFTKVDGFLKNRKGKTGQVVVLKDVGQIALNFFCVKCGDQRTFNSNSKGKLACVFASKKMVSISCTLVCVCGNCVPTWFLIESESDIRDSEPKIRIIKRKYFLPESVEIKNHRYGDFSALLDKAQQACDDGLGAGSIVYLRKILESVVFKIANENGIVRTRKNGKPLPFNNVLKDVDEKAHIIPKEFAKDGYKLFCELSNVVHGDFDEEEGLKKFEPLNRLVIGVLENIKNKQELKEAMAKLNWNIDEGYNDDKTG